MCVGRSQDRSGIPGIECDHTFLRWQQLSQSKIASDSRVNSRLQSTPTKAPSNRSQSRTNESLACRLSENAALRRPVWVKSYISRLNQALPVCPRYGSRHDYSITSSARASSVGGIVRPSAFAVFRLITNSNLVDRITGRSPGFSPLRMRPT